MATLMTAIAILVVFLAVVLPLRTGFNECASSYGSVFEESTGSFNLYFDRQHL